MKKDVNLDLIQRVTDNYFFWQGYRFVPFGVLFLMYAILFLEPQWIPRTGWVTQGIPMFAVLFSLFATSKIGHYYHNHFGRVRSIPGKHITLIGYWWSTGRGREHYLIATALMAVCAFLPTFDIISNWKHLFAIYFGSFGIIYIVGGLLDHRVLIQVFNQSHFGEEDGDPL